MNRLSLSIRGESLGARVARGWARRYQASD